MLKFLIPFNATLAISATHLLTGDPLLVAISGVSALAGTGFAGWMIRRRRATEVASTPFPTFIPSDLPRMEVCPPAAVAERVVEHLGPIQDGDDVIPPFPNMGQHGKSYRGPDYFGYGVGKDD